MEGSRSEGRMGFTCCTGENLSDVSVSRQRISSDGVLLPFDCRRDCITNVAFEARAADGAATLKLIGNKLVAVVEKQAPELLAWLTADMCLAVRATFLIESSDGLLCNSLRC
jgi:hypothetical protein